MGQMHCIRISTAVLLLGAAACRSSEAASSSGEPPAPSPSSSSSAAPADPPMNLPANVETTPALADAGDDAMSHADHEGQEDGDSAGAAPTCPVEMVRIGRYCVDRWEAHLVTVGAEGTEAPWSHVKRLEKGNHYQAKSEPGFFPQGYISRVESTQACENAGKRLCSRTEWIRACKGKKGLRYPYANNLRADVCNSGKIHLLERFHGRNARAWTYEAFNNPELNVLAGYLAKTGEYSACQSDEEVFDMVGNLHEWVSDMVDEDILDILDRDKVDRKKQPWKVGNGIFMGGFYSTTMEHGPGCLFSTIAHEPKYHDYSTGFRCCMDVPGLEKKKKKG
jgi:hypothetical protein